MLVYGEFEASFVLFFLRFEVTASAARELAAALSAQRQMEAKSMEMLAAARDASLGGVSHAHHPVEPTTSAASAAAVASVRELMREQEQRRQTAMASGTGPDYGAPTVFKAPQVNDQVTTLRCNS